MHQQSGWTATPSRLIGTPTSAITTIFTQDALPYTTLLIYPGLGQAPNMLACIPSGLVHPLISIDSELTTVIEVRLGKYSCCMVSSRHHQPIVFDRCGFLTKPYMKIDHNLVMHYCQLDSYSILQRNVMLIFFL